MTIYTTLTLTMTINDPFIEQLVRSHTPILIGENEFYIERSPLGSCDGCYFHEKRCSSKAVTICCSNGGNILKLKEQNNK